MREERNVCRNVTIRSKQLTFPPLMTRPRPQTQTRVARTTKPVSTMVHTVHAVAEVAKEFIRDFPHALVRLVLAVPVLLTALVRTDWPAIIRGSLRVRITRVGSHGGRA
jgi:hypothetical protein